MRSTPVSVLHVNGQRYVVTGFETQWVKNARKVGRGMLARGRKTEQVVLVELPVEERPPILREFPRQVPHGVPFFEKLLNLPSDPEAFAGAAARCPVFRLAQFTSVIAMDLRGFGFSAKPDWPVHSAYSPEAQAKNVLTLLDQLNVESIVLGGYDIGSRVAQMMAHMAPERVHSLVLSAPVYPGFGTRPLEPQAQQERWYQHFHMLPQADQLIGHDQETVRLYLSHFYTHWVGNKQALRPHEFEEIVKTYAQPGAARGSIAWYRAGGGSGQVALVSGNIPPVPITHPTMILWGETDPIAPPAWADRLGDTFSHLLGVQFLPDIGHFVPFEAPEAVVEAIRTVL